MGVVACKLPNGITIDHADRSVTLVGSNDAGAVGGYGLTRDVDIDWFSDWISGPGRDLPMVLNNLIFIAGNDANAADQAREQANERSGMEGLNPNAPSEGIEPTEETRKELDKAPPPRGK